MIIYFNFQCYNKSIKLLQNTDRYYALQINIPTADEVAAREPKRFLGTLSADVLGTDSPVLLGLGMMGLFWSEGNLGFGVTVIASPVFRNTRVMRKRLHISLQRVNR